MRLHSQPLRLQRDRSTPSERIVERREPIAVEQLGRAGVIGVLRAGPPPALPDLRPRPSENLFVGGALPEDELSQDLEQPFPLLLRSNLSDRLHVVRVTTASLEFAPGGPLLR